jgi:hypothetical protein
MTKAKPKSITTIEEAAEVYGGAKTMARAFKLPRREIEHWRAIGHVPKIHHLGMAMGLRMRGKMASPKLFGLLNWKELAGV